MTAANDDYGVAQHDQGGTGGGQYGGIPAIGGLQGMAEPDPPECYAHPVSTRAIALHEAVILGSRLGMEESRVLAIAGEFAEFLFGPDPDADQ